LHCCSCPVSTCSPPPYTTASSSYSPRWSRIGIERPGGFEYADQHLLTLVATMVRPVLGLVPSAIAGLLMNSVFVGV
jgi:hypothetical protein